MKGTSDANVTSGLLMYLQCHMGNWCFALGFPMPTSLPGGWGQSSCACGVCFRKNWDGMLIHSHWHTHRPLLYGAVKFPQKAASHPPVQAVLCCPLLSFVMVCFRSNWSSKWGRKVIYCMYTWRVDVSVSKPAGIFPHSHLYSAQWMVWKGEKNALLMSEVRGECSDCFELRLQLSQTSLFMSPRILLGKISVCLHVHAEEGIFETFKGSHSNLRAEMWPSICFLQQEKLLQRSWLCWC